MAEERQCGDCRKPIREACTCVADFDAGQLTRWHDEARGEASRARSASLDLIEAIHAADPVLAEQITKQLAEAARIRDALGSRENGS